MKICILYDSYDQSNSPLKAVDFPGDPAPYLQGHEYTHVVIHKATAVKQVIELSRQGFDVFFNLCDGAWDEDRPGIEVVQALERLGLAFTGADSAFFEPSREKMKLVCHYWGIGTPAYVMARTMADVEMAAANLRYPLIVKHPSSYSSIGMTRNSRVTNAADLRTQAELMINAYGGALIEEFIEGREFTVLVAENPDDPQNPIAYTPIEFRFPPGETFKHFDMKWVDFHDMTELPVKDQALAARLQEITARLFVGLNGVGYGRTDIRMNADGELFVLEINPNCGLFYQLDDPGSADLVLMNDPAGHQGFVDTILRSAFLRQQKAQKPWKLLLDRHCQYGMYATRAIHPGEVVEAYEEQPHVLVSKSHVLRHWDEQRKRWFAQYAYPLNDEVYVMWSANPEDWKPLNHSCDPNCWLDGLNLVARRAIAPGEQITVDYATFCGPEMEEFICTCNAPNCRGIIRGSDWAAPFLEEYGDHISDYVRAKRSQAARFNSQLSINLNERRGRGKRRKGAKPRPTSRAERKKVFLEAAEKLFAEMERWYGEDPKPALERSRRSFVRSDGS